MPVAWENNKLFSADFSYGHDYLSESFGPFLETNNAVRLPGPYHNAFLIAFAGGLRHTCSVLEVFAHFVMINTILDSRR